MLRSALSKVAWVGRTASMVFGLALVMALVLGVATSAMGANGQNFILGKLNNAATAVTGLVGNVDGGAALRVTNPNSGANDTALDLRVQAGEAPMRVNSAGKVANLNADTLDGKDSSAFVVTGNGQQGNSVTINSCGTATVMSYPLTLTRSGRIFATASSVYSRSSPGPETPTLRIDLLDSSNAVVARSGQVQTNENGATMNISEVLLNNSGNAAYDAPAGNYTLRLFGDLFGSCTGTGQFVSPRLTHVVLAGG